MKDMLTDLIEWRKKLFKPHFVQIPNKEWLYMLKEETRNSVMIEGFFVDEEELQDILTGKYKSSSEISSYFRTARFYYNLALEIAKSNENYPCLSLVKNAHRLLFENIAQDSKKLGDLRHSPVKIAGAKIKPPEYDVYDWIKLWCEYINFVYEKHPVHEATARSHVLFESIHPFEDGNGRVGRILMNFILITRGYINIVIKGEEEDRTKYIDAMEQADKNLREILRESPTKYTPEKLDTLFNKKDTQPLSSLIAFALLESYDRLICSSNENRLVSVEEFAKKSGKSQDAIRKMIERKQLIAYKPKGRWLIYSEQSH